jgi:methyl-accepting chemotaxis protein
MKISGKLSLAFGALLLIFAGVGATSWMNMSGVQREVGALAERYVPELIVAGEVQKQIQDMMYEVRGYNFTYDEAFLDAGRKAAERARDALKKASDLATKYPALVALREGGACSTGERRRLLGVAGRSHAQSYIEQGRRSRVRGPAE